MKKLVIILTCMLICLSLFSGCTNDKDNSNSNTGLGNAVDTDVDIDAEKRAIPLFRLMMILLLISKTRKMQTVL